MPLRHTYFTPGIVAALLCSLCSVPSVRGQERLTSTASNSPLQTEFENRSLRPGTDMRDAYLRNPALIHRMVGERRYFSAENPGFVREKPGTIFIAADGASGRQEGDYLPYEGREFRDFSVRADGYKQGDRATFFARIGLRQEETTTSVGAHCAIPDCTGLTLLPIRRAATSVMKSTI